jgi:hypothetical protein
LELEKIFTRLNRCVTLLGAQYLYALFRKYLTRPANLAATVKAYGTFKSEPQVLSALRAALAKLNRRERADLAYFLLGPPPKVRPRNTASRSPQVFDRSGARAVGSKAAPLLA